MNQSNFYITTTLPYVNAEPHIGFAMEIVAADIVARYHRQQGDRVVFNTGTDEHGQKIYDNALEAGVTPQAYVDTYAAKFDDLKRLLNLSYDHFIRTTDKQHKSAAQEMWRRCKANGDIYKKDYAVKYCVGCELEKTDSELVDGKCPLHPNRELEVRQEENYFFRFSAYQDRLLSLFAKQPNFVLPESKLREIKSFVSAGLQDFSISRLKAKMPWGVPVPDDADHVMYVWFDALTNYISTLGWPDETDEYRTFWPGIQIAGKDNLRQQAAMWQAMLMSAGLPASEQILINGFISVSGQKMSKSLGNVIAPSQMVSRYGVEGTRYVLAAIGPVGDDIDVTWERFDEMYTAKLANGLGNLISRVAKLCERSQLQFEIQDLHQNSSPASHKLEEYDFMGALDYIWSQITQADHLIDQTTPWKIEDPVKLKQILVQLVLILRQVGHDLEPFMPETATAIGQIFAGPDIQATQPIFPRLKD